MIQPKKLALCPLPVVFAMLGACATLTAPTYRSYPLADGSVEIEAVDGDKQTSARFASDGAEHYCKGKGKEPVYIARPEPVYQGPLDESIVAGVKTAGRMVRALGQGRETDPSESISADDDYKVKYLIRCQ